MRDGRELRVSLVTGEFPPDHGGVADYTLCLAKALADRGVDVNILTRRRANVDRHGWPIEDGGTEEDGAAPGFKNGLEPDQRIRIFRVSGVWGWSLGFGLQRMVALTRPDVIHLQYQTAAYNMHPGVNVAPLWLRRTVSSRLAVTYHDVLPPYLFPKAGSLRNFVTLLPARWSHLTVATNPDDFGWLKESSKPRRLELVPIGSNIPDSPPPGFDRDVWRTANGIGPDEELIAYFGMLNESKGARTLIEAMGLLRSAGRPARLVMIGATIGASDPTNRKYQAAVESDIAALDLAELVVWTGHLPRSGVSAWLHAADVVALPYADGASYRRGSLMAALEHGRPVVTTLPRNATEWPQTGVPRLSNGDGALLVPPEDPQALSRALTAVLHSAESAACLAQGAKDLSSSFGWPKIAERHEVLYREAVGTPEMLMPDL